MRLVLFTNVPSHYQISLGKAFTNALPGNFKLVFWNPVPEEQKKLGWIENFDKDWLINAWASDQETKKALDLLHSADIVIWGSGPVYEFNKRIENGKLTFRYTERLFKRGRWRIVDPRVFKAIKEEYKYKGCKSFHLLSVGPHCASDFKLLGAFKGRMWRWGYFPEMPKSINTKKINIKPIILWAGRMISWKRVDLLLNAIAWVRKHGSVHFQLRIIGIGPEEVRLKSLANCLGLADICTFEGPKCPEEVSNAMREADIYVLPSDSNEGWGVVVNEAMGQGCCVVGSISTGSVPWLIQDQVNGRIFKGGNPENLGRILLWCLDNPDRRSEMGVAARNTIIDLWSPEVAAERLLWVSEELEKGCSFSFHDKGPCSSA